MTTQSRLASTSPLLQLIADGIRLRFPIAADRGHGETNPCGRQAPGEPPPFVTPSSRTASYRSPATSSIRRCNSGSRSIMRRDRPSPAGGGIGLSLLSPRGIDANSPMSCVSRPATRQRSIPSRAVDRCHARSISRRRWPAPPDPPGSRAKPSPGCRGHQRAARRMAPARR